MQCLRKERAWGLTAEGLAGDDTGVAGQIPPLGGGDRRPNEDGNELTVSSSIATEMQTDRRKLRVQTAVAEASGTLTDEKTLKSH